MRVAKIYQNFMGKNVINFNQNLNRNVAIKLS